MWVFILVFAGNLGATGSDRVLYPAKHDNVISVGAHKVTGQVSDLSSVGDAIDFLCPGEQIRSTSNESK